MNKLANRLRLSGLFDLASLFAGRIGGILVTLFFIPRYDRLLGADVFGAVSVVLSLQAFFLVSDLGLATLVSRDTAIARDDPVAMTPAVLTRRRAEWMLAGIAVAIAGVGVMLPLIAGAVVPWSFATGGNVAMVAVLAATLVAINIAQLCLNAVGQYHKSAGSGFLGAFVRGAATMAGLTVVPNLTSFLVVQVVVALAHFVVVRRMVERACGNVPHIPGLLDRTALMALLRRCVPLTLYTLAAAAAVNLDKSIVSAFVSLEMAGRYFLATTYAMVPVAVLSGPLNSYFAPKIMHAVHTGDGTAERRIATTFQTILICAVVGPSLGLGVQMEWWLPLWLPNASGIAAVMEVAPILLAGGALSATGYYFTTYLIAVGDNAYLAKLSVACGITVLAAALFFASRQDMWAFATAYFAFYAAGFVGLAVRSAALKGAGALGAFLLRAYVVPLVLVAGGYAVGRMMVGPAAPLPLFLVVPMLFAGLGGAAALALLSFVPARAGLLSR